MMIIFRSVEYSYMKGKKEKEKEEKGELNNKIIQTYKQKEEIDSVRITLLVERRRGALLGSFLKGIY